MKKLFVVLTCLYLAFPCRADTFTNRKTGEVFNGYMTQTKRGNKTLIRVGKKGGAKYVDMSDYRVEWNYLGRKNQVVVIPIKEKIELESETIAFEKAIKASSNQGPAFILIEIDTPGGRADLMKRICSAITKTNNCLTVAFISGGKYGGAYSAGAIIALACNYIYMADDTAIGAATTVVVSDSGIKDLKSAFGATVAEKLMSADRAYVASIAEQNGRSGALAKAMVDEDVKVLEVIDNGGRFFVEPGNRKRGQTVVRTWSKKGSLLTLTASEAAECRIAHGLARSRKAIVSAFRLEKPRIVQNNEAAKARRAFESAKDKLEKITISIDRYLKEIQLSENKSRSVRLLDKLIKKYKEVIALGKAHPDLAIDEEACRKAINSAKTIRSNIK
ncbi:MAG: hypothetical protein ACYS0C_05725 [Planctomycetota bacterium]